MNKTKKVIIIFSVVVVLFLTTLGFYYWQRNKPETATPTATPTKPPQESKAKLSVKVNPIGARVIISAFDSSYLEERTGSFEIEVPAEKLYLTAFLPYFENSNQEIEIKEGETRNVEFNLKHLGRDIIEGAPVENNSQPHNPNNLIPNP